MFFMRTSHIDITAYTRPFSELEKLFGSYLENLEQEIHSLADFGLKLLIIFH